MILQIVAIELLSPRLAQRPRNIRSFFHNSNHLHTAIYTHDDLVLWL